jgi:hypothetical protein
MNNLFNRIINYIRAYPYRSLVIVLTVIVIVSLILRLLYPPKPTTQIITTDIQRTIFTPVRPSNPFDQLTLETNDFPTQTEAKVYTVENYVADNQLLVNIASILKLDPALDSKFAYYSRDNQVTVSMNNYFKIVSYSNTANQPQGGIVSFSEAVRFSNIFLAELKLSTADFQLNENLTKYQTGEFEPVAVSPSEASTITLFYQRSQDNLPISLSISPGNSIIINVSDRGVYKATIPALFFTQTEKESIPLITIETAVSKIKNGDYYILGQINNPLTYDQITSPITAFIVTDVKLEYRYDDKQKLLLPFYRMTGVAGFSSGEENIPVSLITPAFEPQI